MEREPLPLIWGFHIYVSIHAFGLLETSPKLRTLNPSRKIAFREMVQGLGFRVSSHFRMKWIAKVQRIKELFGRGRSEDDFIFVIFNAHTIPTEP